MILQSNMSHETKHAVPLTVLKLYFVENQKP